MSSFTIDKLLSTHPGLNQVPSGLVQTSSPLTVPYNMLPFYAGLLRPSQPDFHPMPLSVGLNSMLLEQQQQQQIIMRAYQQRIMELERTRLAETDAMLTKERLCYNNDSSSKLDTHTTSRQISSATSELSQGKMILHILIYLQPATWHAFDFDK